MCVIVLNVISKKSYGYCNKCNTETLIKPWARWSPRDFDIVNVIMSNVIIKYNNCDSLIQNVLLWSIKNDIYLKCFASFYVKWSAKKSWK